MVRWREVMRVSAKLCTLPALMALVAGAYAQNDNCNGGTAASTPTIRAEGTTELVCNYTFTCSGGGSPDASLLIF